MKKLEGVHFCVQFVTVFRGVHFHAQAVTGNSTGKLYMFCEGFTKRIKKQAVS